jgi:hypothetical protein
VHKRYSLVNVHLFEAMTFWRAGLSEFPVTCVWRRPDGRSLSAWTLFSFMTTAGDPEPAAAVSGPLPPQGRPPRRQGALFEPVGRNIEQLLFLILLPALVSVRPRSAEVSPVGIAKTMDPLEGISVSSS